MTTAGPHPVPTARIIGCPHCGGRSVYAANQPYRPFCSARCKGGDFGAWASESYRVESAPPVDADDGVEGEVPGVARD